MYTAHASTGGPRVIRCFPRPTDRQHLLQVHTLEIESTYDARPRETTFNAPFLTVCARVLFRVPLLPITPTLSSVYMYGLYTIVEKNPRSEKRSEREPFDKNYHECCRYCVNLNEFYRNIFQRIKEKRWLFGSTLSFIPEEFLSLSQEVKLWRKRAICRAGKFSKRVSI